MINKFKTFWKDQQDDDSGISQAEIIRDPERAYNRGAGVQRIRETLEEAGYSEDEIDRIISSFY